MSLVMMIMMMPLCGRTFYCPVNSILIRNTFSPSCCVLVNTIIIISRIVSRTEISIDFHPHYFQRTHLFFQDKSTVPILSKSVSTSPLLSYAALYIFYSTDKFSGLLSDPCHHPIFWIFV